MRSSSNVYATLKDVGTPGARAVRPRVGGHDLRQNQGHRPTAGPRRLGPPARSGRSRAGTTRSTGMVMEPLDPASGARPETRRPLLMDPAGARPSGFAPPSVLSQPATGQPPAPGQPADRTGVGHSRSRRRLPSARRRCWPATPSRRRPVRCRVRHRSDRSARWSGSVCGHSSSRIDLVLPDRSTIAETLETVLELAPRSLREQAIAHGGWILRTAAGEPIPGSVTLLDQGIVDGATLFLTGIDAADSAAVYDDVADAVADTVLTDPSAWPASGGRTVALGAAGLFAALTCLALLWSGPPWAAVAITLGVHRRAGPGGRRAAVPRGRRCRRATVAGLFSVATGVAAATVATAGSVRSARHRGGAAAARRGCRHRVRDNGGAGDRYPTGAVRGDHHRLVAAVRRAGLLCHLRSAAGRRRRDRRRPGPRADAAGAQRGAAVGPIRAGTAAQYRRRGLRGPRDRRRPGSPATHPAGRWLRHRTDPGADLADPRRLRDPGLQP